MTKERPVYLKKNGLGRELLDSVAKHTIVFDHTTSIAAKE